MKYRIKAIALAFALCLSFLGGFSAPVEAYNMGKVGQTNTVSAGAEHTVAITEDGYKILTKED